MEQKIFEFKNIFVEVFNQDKKIDANYVRLLDGISGSFKSGRLTAVMGASGAGKSTLFDVLLGRIDNSSKTYGTVLYKGKERATEDWIHQVSYLKQFDTFFPKFSIMESIMFNLDFYKPNLSTTEKTTFAEEILKMSNIYEKRYAYVESLSGGECKRAMIALSLCADPDILFMDEPTSGLDSHSALILINFMKIYAEKCNKIIVISLHQPGEALLNLFEDLLYLGRGAVFYEGKVSRLEGWLEEKGLKKLDGISLAEYIFELHSDNPYPPEIAQTRPKIEKIIEDNRQQRREIHGRIELKAGLSNMLIRTNISFSDMLTLWRRFYLNVWRIKNVIVTIFFNLLIIGLITAIILFPCYSSIKEYAIENGSSSDRKFSDFVDATKQRLSSTGCDLFINETIIQDYPTTISFALGIFSYDFFTDIDIISNDILSGKCSTLTYFISYLLHDIISTSLWVSVTPLVFFISPLRSLLPWVFLPLFLLYAACYAIELIFLRHLCKGSTKVAIYLLSGIIIMYTACGTAVFDSVAGFSTKYLWWFKYFSYIYLLFPVIIIFNIFQYRQYNLEKSVYSNSEVYIDRITEFRISITKKQVFDFLRLNDLPSYWLCYAILFASIIFNLLVSFYLFNKQIRNYIRIKLN